MSLGFGINASAEVATALSEAIAVNRGGDVVGGSGGHALLVHNGTMTDLGLGEATGINDVGQIVGNSQGAFVISGYSHAIMWSKGTITDLGTLGSTQSAAYAIDDNGQIVASGSNAQGQEHAFLLNQLVCRAGNLRDIFC